MALRDTVGDIIDGFEALEVATGVKPQLVVGKNAEGILTFTVSAGSPRVQMQSTDALDCLAFVLDMNGDPTIAETTRATKELADLEAEKLVKDARIIELTAELVVKP